MAVGQVAGPHAGLAAADVVHGWLSDHVPGTHGAPTPASSQPAPAQPAGQPADPGAKDRGSDPHSRGEYWYDQLTGIIKSVTAELEQEFHAEAQRTLRVLAAAIDLFKDRVATTPGVEIEYERLCLEFQQDIWPGKFSEASAKVTADLTALQQQVHNATAAADQVAVLAGQATRL